MTILTLKALPNGLLNDGEPTQLCLRSSLLNIQQSPINPRFKKTEWQSDSQAGSWKEG